MARKGDNNNISKDYQTLALTMFTHFALYCSDNIDKGLLSLFLV